MATNSRSVSVGSTATRLDTATETDRPSGSSVAIYNNGSVTVYIGASNVTTSNGVPVPAGTWGPSVDLATNESLYGIVASGTCEVRVLEAGI